MTYKTTLNKLIYWIIIYLFFFNVNLIAIVSQLHTESCQLIEYPLTELAESFISILEQIKNKAKHIYTNSVSEESAEWSKIQKIKQEYYFTFKKQYPYICIIL